MTGLGLKTEYNKLDDYTGAGDEKAVALLKSQLVALKRDFDPARLGEQAALSAAVFEQQASQLIANQGWRDHGFIYRANGTPTGALPTFMINNHRIDAVTDAEAYIARLKEVERVLSEVSADLVARTDKGLTLPRLVFAPSIADARKVLAGAPFTMGADTPVWTDFKSKVEKLNTDAATKARLIDQARMALTGPFKRGYEKAIATLESVTDRAGRDDGVWRLQGGAAYYANQLRNWTTTDKTADEIHQIGLTEAARIRAEMEQIKARVGYAGKLESFLNFVRTDPRFHYPNTDAGREQYLTDARAYIAQVLAKAPAYFHRLPKAALEVRAVEKWREATASIAFYNRPAPDGSRPGLVYFNLADLSQTLKPHVEDVSYHEGAPGHHFQISIAQELEGLPKFRRYGGPGAYIEGWALYTEGLSKEMGFYQDPYNDLARLASELWRAARLVVDTGMHAKRWSRDKALQYLKENSLLSDLDAAREIDRYLTNPGQATSYMMGQLKILELRCKAETALGDKYDIRDFHDAVLADGAVPLSTLEDRINAYVAKKKG
ncbi:MAG: DUF885 domain-containing protein [Alphaproteobacteria bacterium]|nr:DUF885 domain-containing protein [Alphaproteobacteria bacterium]